MKKRYQQMVAEEARRNLARLESTEGTVKNLRRGIAFDLAIRQLSQNLPAQERQELLCLALENGYLRKDDLVSDDTSLSSLVQRSLRGCSDSRPRIAI